MKNLLKKFGFILILILTESVLFIATYKPDTYLVGWDNVYPELNFRANLMRDFFSVWQEYRGLGVIDGMAHAANLPHTLFLYLLSFLMPNNFLRYFYTFFMHFLGGVGIYLLIKKLTTGSNDNKRLISSFAPLFGALFYQLNLITVQMFYTPLEVFSTHFAFVPLLIYTLLVYLQTRLRKVLLLFASLSLLSSPQAHVPSVFLVYFFTATVVCIFHILTTQHKRIALKTAGTALFFTALINSFWGLPYVYTTLHASKTIVNSKINQMSTDNVVLRNKAFGSFMDVALMRGFSLDYIDLQMNGENNYMMLNWRNHIRQPVVFFISLCLFLAALAGMVLAIVRKERKFYPFGALWIIMFLLLGNDIPVLSLFSETLYKAVPLFYNVYRFTFTKFSIVYALTYAIFMSYLLSIILKKLQNSGKIIVIFLLIAGLFVYSLPAFTGNFISENLRVKIPQDYFDLISFFNKLPENTRVATLPQPSYWGWVYYRWGVRGSGFLWYGIPQPTMDGAFYPWSQQNENYYWEMTNAYYSSDVTKFEKVLEKYQISWLVIDYSIISPFSPKALFTDRFDEYAVRSSLIKPFATIGNLKIYYTGIPTLPDNFIYTVKKMNNIQPVYPWGDNDNAYLLSGNYVSDHNSRADIYYPFRSLFTGRTQDELMFKITEYPTYFLLETKIPGNQAGSVLEIPALNRADVTEYDSYDPSYTLEKPPKIMIDGNEIPISPDNKSEKVKLTDVKKNVLQVQIPKINGYYGFDSDANSTVNSIQPVSCDPFNQGLSLYEPTDEPGKQAVKLTSMNANNCLEINLPQLSQKYGYIVSVDSKNESGHSLLLSVYNRNSQRAELEVYLPHKQEFNSAHYIIPPLGQFAQGYDFRLNNSSIGSERTVNQFSRLEVHAIPYNFLSGIRLIAPSAGVKSLGTDNVGSFIKGITHPNPGLYEVALSDIIDDSKKDSYIVLSQSFDSGWKAYSMENDSWFARLFIPFIGAELKKHLLVNNWENGWDISNLPPRAADRIIIVYTPQYLEYIGFILLIISFIFLSVSLYKDNKTLS